MDYMRIIRDNRHFFILLNYSQYFDTSRVFRHVHIIAKSDCYLCHVCLCLYGTIWLPLEGIWYLIIFRTTVKRIQVSFKSDKITETLHEDVCTFMVLSQWIILRMRKVSGKICSENQNTHLTFSKFFPKKIIAIYEIMWKNMVQPDKPQMTI